VNNKIKIFLEKEAIDLVTIPFLVAIETVYYLQIENYLVQMLKHIQIKLYN